MSDPGWGFDSLPGYSRNRDIGKRSSQLPKSRIREQDAAQQDGGELFAALGQLRVATADCQWQGSCRQPSVKRWPTARGRFI
jgi:hypothetical protein